MANLRIATQAIFQLGRELITDDAMAIGELIKNAYDADAASCKVTIETSSQAHEGSQFTGQEGYIVIEDNGDGMTAPQLVERWLHISFSHKRAKNDDGTRKRTKKNRTPLGDKGLGRLGAQRLGNCLEIFTKTESAAAAGAAIRWSDYANSQDLSQVPVEIKQATAKAQEVRKTKGTTVLISGLRINTDDLQERLEVQLSRLLSPVPQVKGFNVSIKLDGEIMELTRLRDELRNQAPVYYTFAWKQDSRGNYLEVDGYMQLDALRPGKAKVSYFDKYVKDDNGAAFFRFLDDVRTDPRNGTLDEGPSPWYLHYKATYNLAEIGPLEQIAGVKQPHGIRIDQSNHENLPGQFAGKSYYYDMGLLKDLSLENQERYNQIVALVDRLAGVHVYRDGFEVGVDSDWLQMSEKVQRTGSYYDLRPTNTVGYVQISAEHNPNLQEVTDRQTLLENQAYKTFRLILQQFVTFASYWQRTIRRQLNKYLAQRIEQDVNNDIVHTAQSLAEDMKRDVRGFAQVRDADDLANRVHRVEQKIDLFEMKFEQLEEDRDVYLRFAGIGLTAASLHHELEMAGPRLKSHLDALQKRLKDLPDANEEVVALNESLTRLLKLMGYITPTIRYVQERRIRFNLRGEMESFADYWRARFPEGVIEVRGNDERNACHVKMPRGILTQALDNLFTNSRYWSQQGDEKPPRIRITVDGSQIHVTDSGPGVDSRMEPVLFQVGKSLRPGGTGMGLHIARNALGKVGGRLDLTGVRKAGRRGQFTIDLEGVLDDEAS